MTWKEDAEKDGPSNAERIPDGPHEVTVTKIIFGKKDGPAFTSKAGDPQIMLILSDKQGREVSDFHTLSLKARWTLAKLLSASGANIELMDEHGVDIKQFAESDFAEKQLMGRRFTAQVEWKENNGKKFADITPLKDPVGAEEPVAAMSNEDTPF